MGEIKFLRHGNLPIGGFTVVSYEDEIFLLQRDEVVIVLKSHFASSYDKVPLPKELSDVICSNPFPK